MIDDFIILLCLMSNSRISNYLDCVPPECDEKYWYLYWLSTDGANRLRRELLQLKIYSKFVDSFYDNMAIFCQFRDFFKQTFVFVIYI